MRKKLDRSLALLLALSMAMSLLSGSAWAAEAVGAGDSTTWESSSEEAETVVQEEQQAETKEVQESAQAQDKTEEQIESGTQAEEERPSLMATTGTCGDNLTWTLDDADTLTISGTGEMTSFRYSTDVPWNNERSAIKKVIINSGVTSIEFTAFLDCINLIDISIPDSVTTIKASAFYNCRNLRNVRLPDALTCIDEGAFYGCSALTDLTIPKSVTYIGASTFALCENLISITLPDNITNIESHTFSGCTNLSKVELPNDLISIKEGVFNNCSNLSEISFPAGLSRIGEGAFTDCVSLDNVILPDKITTIESHTFSGCKNLKNITLSSETKMIDSVAFGGCEKISRITFPDKLNRIGSYAFSGCKRLNNISFPNPSVDLDDGVFESCSSLTTISLPDNLDNIAASTFRGCKNLTSISLPQNVHSIKEDAFESCDKLENVVFSDNIVEIGSNAFMGCGSLTNIKLPNKLKKIETGAFFGCNGLTSIVIPNSVTTLGGEAFAYCIYLTDITLSDKITSIEDGVFKNCWSLKEIKIPASVTDIGFESFYYSGLNSIIFKGNPPSISVDAFANVTATAYYPKDNNLWEDAVKQDYGGTLVWEISKTNISECTVTMSEIDFTYDGREKTPHFSVRDNKIHLSENTDYIVDFNNNIDAGIASVTITGLNDYMGSITRTFEITQCDISSSRFSSSLSEEMFVYNDSEKTPNVIVKNGDKVLTVDTDYTLTYTNNINAGIAKVTINGCGNYKGIIENTFTIKKSDQIVSASLSPERIRVSDTATVSATGVGAIAFASSDESVATVSENGVVTGIAPGTAVITITATGDENTNGASTTVTITVLKPVLDIATCTVTLDKDNYVYDGREQKPVVTVHNGNNELNAYTDYTVTYANNINAGTATVTVEGKGNYEGSVEKHFTIDKAGQTITAKNVIKILGDVDFKLGTKTTGVGAFT